VAICGYNCSCSEETAELGRSGVNRWILTWADAGGVIAEASGVGKGFPSKVDGASSVFPREIFSLIARSLAISCSRAFMRALSS
jgi:hypothetical protein